MGIYIKNGKLPKTCFVCDAIGVDADGMSFCRRIGEHLKIKRGEYRDNRCPIVEVKEPHGRLIDGDRLCKRIEPREEWSEIYGTVAGIITDAPTVIEAEDGKDS